jgi:hypothetical protein
MNVMKRMVVAVAVVALLISFSVPAMAQVCQPTDVDCVEPPPADTYTPVGPAPTYTVEPSTANTYCEPIFCPQPYNVDYGSPPVWWPW